MLICAGILTKQLLLKERNNLPTIYDDIPTDFKTNDDDYKEEVSEMSNASNNEPCVKYYKSTTNTKGKMHTKSRRYIKCRKLSIAYCSCCKKTFCYSVGGKMNNRTYLVDHIKEIKRSRGRKRPRRNVV